MGKVELVNCREILVGDRIAESFGVCEVTCVTLMGDHINFALRNQGMVKQNINNWVARVLEETVEEVLLRVRDGNIPVMEALRRIKLLMGY